MGSSLSSMFSTQPTQPPAAVSKQSFFASGAQVDHGNHVHVFNPHDDHFHVVTVAFVSSQSTMGMLMQSDLCTPEVAYTLYLSMVNDAVGNSPESMQTSEFSGEEQQDVLPMDATPTELETSSQSNESGDEEAEDEQHSSPSQSM
jgi:hypothetical protein